MKRSLSAYCAMTFAISWGGMLLAIGAGGGMHGTTPASDPRFAFAVMAMLAGPSVMGLVMTALVDGRSGLHDFSSRLLTWRVGARWYAVALLTAPAIMTATLLALSFNSPAFLPGIFVANDKASLLLVSLAVGVSAGMFEELGWTGFAIPTVRRRRSVLATGVFVGILWSAWHLLPSIWSRHAAAADLDMSVYLAATAVGVFVGYLTAFRVLMVWVYERTDSILLAMLMHMSITASLLILNPIGLAGAHLQAYSFVLAGAVWVIVAVVTLASRRQSTPEILRRRAA